MKKPTNKSEIPHTIAYPNATPIDKMASVNAPQKEAAKKPEKTPPVSKKAEIGGPKGLEPTRYGDWEKNGRCIDF